MNRLDISAMKNKAYGLPFIYSLQTSYSTYSSMRYSLGTIPMSPFISPTHQPNMSYSCGKKTNRKTDNRRSLNSLTDEANQSSDTISEVKSHRSALRGMKSVNIYIDNLPFIFGFCLIFFSYCLYPYIPTPILSAPLPISCILSIFPRPIQGHKAPRTYKDYTRECERAIYFV